MHAYKVFAFCAVAGLIAAADASATFTWLPANFVANGVSKDGRIIVGQDTTTNTAAYCFQGSVVDLSGADVGSSANACSRHGEIIAGRSGSGMPFYWSSAGGFQLLPLKSGFTSGRATVVSADASTIGGDCTYVYDSQYYGSSPVDSAVVWTAPNWNVVPLDPEDGAQDDANGGQGSLKSISDDGSFIAGELDYVWIKVFPGSLNTTNFDMYESRGSARGFDGRYYLNRNRFFGCVQFNGVIYKRGNTGYTRTVISDTFPHRASAQPGDDATETAAMAMTGDARSIFACSYYMQSDEYDSWPGPRLMDAEGVFTFRHTSNGQRLNVGDSSGFEARACTDDGLALFGRIVLGHYNGAPFEDLYSFGVGNKAILDYRNSNTDLVSLLNSQGGNVPAGATLFGNPIYCSSDGSVIVGSGQDAQQHTMSWMATISSDPVSLSLAPDEVQGGQNASAYVGPFRTHGLQIVPDT